MTRVEKYKHRVNYCSSFEVWMGRFREIEGLEIRDGEREQEEEERGEEDEDYEEEGGSLLSEQVVFGWLEKKGTFGYDKRFYFLLFLFFFFAFLSIFPFSSLTPPPPSYSLFFFSPQFISQVFYPTTRDKTTGIPFK